MHLLIITQYYPPETGALPSRWGDFSKILANQHCKVTILCESPHYPNKNYYRGYKNTFFSTHHKNPNLTIIRTKAFASDRKTFLKKMLHYLVFMFFGIINLRKIKKFDTLIISSPPLFTGVIGLFAKKFHNQDFWLDIRDLWPDSALALGQIREGILFNFGKYLEKKIYANAKGFIFPVPGFRDYLSKFSSEISSKPMIDLMNGVSKDFLNKAANIKTNKEKKFIVLYSGNMGLAQDLNTVIKAAKILKDYEIYFSFIGQGVCKEEIMKTSQNLGNKVEFKDSMPRDKLIKYIKNSSICLVPLKNKKLFKRAIPSKIFEYMACKKPIILGVSGYAGELVLRSKCGMSVPPENSKVLARAILTYFNNEEKLKKEGENGLRFVTRNLEKEVLVSSFIKKIKA